ncbi:MAG: hypothetical protein B1H06_03120 [Candidatus Cloacimonas sp. 4484_143]|nr:MAG: hypothetical protein B1H06_03120 [Candidatus Cloacimonas sp. 4484_143]RLC52265.1 MAG: hypothetical protein DRI23_03230 [Candidatus Cloacimonadota bacterium]RLC54252.1 MAG: hypothetical protein DRH79_01155 [Candidatus Cloacimonadota bacterium]
MKNSIIIIIFFALGITAGRFSLIPEFLLENDLSSYALYLLIFLVGIAVGSDVQSWKILKQEKFLILLVPLTTIAGTLLGVGIVSFFLPEIDLRESLAVGAGFGYYSLSSIIITQIVSPALGVIALLSNITREIITLLFTPIMAKYLGKLAPVTSGGATSMDTTLPIITRYCGKQYAIISVFHGTILTILVPVIVTFILKV